MKRTKKNRHAFDNSIRGPRLHAEPDPPDVRAEKQRLVETFIAKRGVTKCKAASSNSA